MRTIVAVLVCGMLAIAGPAAAEPAGPKGDKCESSETGAKHQINGKNYTCDKCVYSSCNTSGGTVSGCTRTTYWSNCVEAASAITPGGGRMQLPPSVQPGQTQTKPKNAQ